MREMAVALLDSADKICMLNYESIVYYIYEYQPRCSKQDVNCDKSILCVYIEAKHTSVYIKV